MDDRVAGHAPSLPCCSFFFDPPPPARYGMGLFPDISTVAYASDAVSDLIPVDVTASLCIAAAAAV